MARNDRPRSEELREQRKTTRQLISETTGWKKSELEEIKKYEKELDREVTASKGVLLRRLEDEYHEKRIENLKEEGKHIEALFQDKFGTRSAINKTLSSTAQSLTDVIDKSLDKYIGAQQSMTAHLQGSNTTLQGVLNNLQSTLSTSTIVKQEKVFDNLSNLIKSGITYNVEQRAFLQTIASDIDSVFNAQNGSLTRLIRIQNQDLSANRLAIEYSLQKFLNQNYETSEYIRTAFNDVSNSLMSAQVALQNSTEAIRLESAVQTQLGAMYSGGISDATVKGLADAINALGTGDVSNMGSGMSNLLIMAAARAGMDYGQLLNQGVTGQQATTLLNSVVNYLAEMNASESNVVKSQLGKLFGVDITDIIAAGNVGQVGGTVGSDINALFNDYTGFMTSGTKIKNIIDNLKWSFGTNIADSTGSLVTYEVTKLIKQSGLGDMLFNLGDAVKTSGSGSILGSILGSIGNKFGAGLQFAGILANSAPLLPVIYSFLKPNGTFSDIMSSINTGGLSGGNVASLFAALGSSGSLNDLNNATVKMSQAGTSGSIYIGSGSTTDLLRGSMSSIGEVASLASSVTSTVSGDEVTWEENVSTITSDVASILEILNNYMDNISDNLDIIATSTSFSAGGALGVGAGLVYNHIL